MCEQVSRPSAGSPEEGAWPSRHFILQVKIKPSSTSSYFSPLLLLFPSPLPPSPTPPPRFSPFFFCPTPLPLHHPLLSPIPLSKFIHRLLIVLTLQREGIDGAARRRSFWTAGSESFISLLLSSCLQYGYTDAKGTDRQLSVAVLSRALVTTWLCRNKYGHYC